MGTVYRKSVTKPIPAGAEFFTKAGERLARWKDAKGKTRTATITIGRDGQERIEITARTFMAKYRDGQGIVREVATGCRDEQAARAVLAALEKRAENVRSGINTAAEDGIIDHAATPIVKHLDAYVIHLQAKGSSAVHLSDIRRLSQRIITECRFTKLSDISRDSVESWLVQKTTDKMAARTRNTYLQAIRGFCNWCVLTSRLSVNPLQRLSKADEKSDRRRQRRAMTEPELVKLLEASRWRPLAEFGRQTIAKEETERKGKRSNWTYAPLTLDDLPAAVERARARLKNRPEFITKLERLGRERALIYKTLVLTGLRKGELASLTVGQLYLDGPQAFAELHAADEKNRQGSQIAIRDDLANDLREWLAEKHAASQIALRGNGKTLSMLPPANKLPAATPIFSLSQDLVKVFDKDLQVAGIAKADERGRTLDVHALRHSFGTLLSRGGVSPRTAQSALRHSSIDLTMNVYTDPKLLDVHGALDSLPSLPISSSPFKAPETIRATGTNDLRQNQFAPKFAPTTGKRVQTEAFPDKVEDSGDTSNLNASRNVSAYPVKEKPSLTFSDNEGFKYSRVGSNHQPSASEADALSN